MTAPLLETLHIAVRASPATDDHEVVLTSEHGDLIARFADGMMGLDPDDLLVEPCRLLPGDTAHQACIGRCDCGVGDCGNVEVTITCDGQVVAWTTPERSVGARFDATAYVAEVRRALRDFGWESADRTAARLIASALDRRRLAQAGFTFSWASGRLRATHMTLALHHGDGPYQILVDVPWQGRAPADVAEVCCQLLREPAHTWPDVRWYPLGRGLGPPRFAGPGWRRDTH